MSISTNLSPFDPETNLEYILTHAYKAEMIAYLKAHPEDFAEAANLAVAEIQPYSWRAAWLLWSCMEKNDHRLRPHINEMIDAIPGKKDGHRRELIKILQEMEMNDDQQGMLFNICADIWEKTAKSPSVRYQAIRFMVAMAKKYPDLANEIILFTRPQYMDSLSPGIKKGVHKMIGKIKTENLSDKNIGTQSF
jgi:hypothetical protein